MWLSWPLSLIINIIHDDLGLVKKSARWVSKLLSQEQKDNRIACSRELKKVVMGDVEDG